MSRYGDGSRSALIRGITTRLASRGWAPEYNDSESLITVRLYGLTRIATGQGQPSCSIALPYSAACPEAVADLAAALISEAIDFAARDALQLVPSRARPLGEPRGGGMHVLLRCHEQTGEPLWAAAVVGDDRLPMLRGMSPPVPPPEPDTAGPGSKP